MKDVAQTVGKLISEPHRGNLHEGETPISVRGRDDKTSSYCLQFNYTDYKGFCQYKNLTQNDEKFTYNCLS